MAVVKGKNLFVFTKSEDDKYTALAAAKDQSLNVTLDTEESTSKDSGIWKENSPGRVSWEMQTNNLMVIADYDTLFSAMVSRTPLNVAFEVASNAENADGVPADGWTISTGGYEGQAYITSLQASAPESGDATYSATFTGTGKLTKRSAS
jgi:TP901-1 family phage major tail protein